MIIINKTKYNGFYIADIDIDDSTTGVNKKIKDQIEAFKTNNIFLNLVSFPKLKLSVLEKIILRLPLTNYPFNRNVYKYFKETNIGSVDVIYIRKPMIDLRLITVMKLLRNKWPNVKIIMEIPTYPYDDEFKNRIYDLPLLIKEKVNRTKIRKYIDIIATYSNHDKIFGLPTLKIINGVDFRKIRPRIVTNYDTNVIQIVAVAIIDWWHGYDRLINGLGEYYENGGKRKIILHLVGDGNAIGEYKKKVEYFKINDNVIFYGKKIGSELDEIYDNCSLAVETLGIHRKNISHSSSLKSREYGAKGLPMISSCKIDFIPQNYPYHLKVPADETNINIKSLIAFVDRIYPDNTYFNDVNLEIRSFSKQHVDIFSTIKPIVSYIIR